MSSSLWAYFPHTVGVLYMILHLFIYLFFLNYALTCDFINDDVNYKQSFLLLFLVCLCLTTVRVCVWICETGDKFSFVRSLQCERREVRWQKLFGLDFSDKSPPGAFVLFLPDVESVVLWNHVSFSIFRLPILTSKCDPVRTALICFSCFVVDVCFTLMKSHPF